MATYRTYRGQMISPASRNTMGLRWEAHVNGRFLRADTLTGLRSLIRDELDGRPCWTF